MKPRLSLLTRPVTPDLIQGPCLGTLYGSRIKSGMTIEIEILHRIQAAQMEVPAP